MHMQHILEGIVMTRPPRWRVPHRLSGGRRAYTRSRLPREPDLLHGNQRTFTFNRRHTRTSSKGEQGSRLKAQAAEEAVRGARTHSLVPAWCRVACPPYMNPAHPQPRHLGEAMPHARWQHLCRGLHGFYVTWERNAILPRNSTLLRGGGELPYSRQVQICRILQILKKNKIGY